MKEKKKPVNNIGFHAETSIVNKVNNNPLKKNTRPSLKHFAEAYYGIDFQKFGGRRFHEGITQPSMWTRLLQWLDVLTAQRGID